MCSSNALINGESEGGTLRLRLELVSSPSPFSSQFILFHQAYYVKLGSQSLCDAVGINGINTVYAPVYALCGASPLLITNTNHEVSEGVGSEV